MNKKNLDPKYFYKLKKLLNTLMAFSLKYLKNELSKQNYDVVTMECF